MKTIDAEQWGEIWGKSRDRPDSTSVLAAVDEEANGVRCQKILAYLKTRLGVLSGLRTIEIGCGGGIYSMIVARLGARVTLMDYSAEALSLAERNLQALHLSGEFVLMDAFNLPQGQREKYDIAMSFGTVEHYHYPERLAICQSHVDLIRPGGAAIISTPNIYFLPHELLKALLAVRGKWFLGYEGSFSRSEMFHVARQLELQHAMIAGSSWWHDVRRYGEIVRDTQTFRRWFPRRWHLTGSGSMSGQPQKHHWLDDYIGHDIALLGTKPAVEI